METDDSNPFWIVMGILGRCHVRETHPTPISQIADDCSLEEIQQEKFKPRGIQGNHT